MIAAEAFTYAFAGCVVGCTAGLLLNKLIYDKLITSHFHYYTWRVSLQTLLIILLFVFLAAMAAIYASSKRIWIRVVTELLWPAVHRFSIINLRFFYNFKLPIFQGKYGGRTIWQINLPELL